MEVAVAVEEAVVEIITLVITAAEVVGGL